MATNNVLDTVLSQYENSKSGDYTSGSKMSQEDRLKKYFLYLILKDNERWHLKKNPYFTYTRRIFPFKKYGFMKSILMENESENFMIREK